MKTFEKDYLDLMAQIVFEGETRLDRTGVGIKSYFGAQLDIPLKKYFPAVTTKKLQWKLVVGELMWFLQGGSDTTHLAELSHGDKKRNTIWSANAEAWDSIKKTNCGDIYGPQWRGEAEHQHVDQINQVIYDLKHNPHSRRHIVSAWSPDTVYEGKGCLPPCHVMFQFYVNKDGLSCHMYQRSADMFLGVPFNIASYALLTHIIAQITGINEVDRLVISFGDAHIYKNHLNQVKEQIFRFMYEPPTLEMPKFNTLGELFDYDVSEFKLINYENHGVLSAPMAV